MKLSDLTLIQILGIVLVINGALSSAAGEMTDLFGPVWAKHVLSICVIGSGICGGMITMFGGMGTQVKNVLAMPGVEKVTVNAQASQELAAVAVSPDPSLSKIEPAPGTASRVETIAKAVATVLMVAFALSLFLATDPAMAQAKQRFVPTGDLIGDTRRAVDPSAPPAPTKQQATAALPCMDISMITKLTPQNLVPTMKACVQDLNNQLVSDTQRALDSAKEFSGSASGNSAAVGDNDAVNCLTPALALFKAAAIVPAIPEVPAVTNPDGTIKTPAVAAVPEQDPGPILLYQKYREFTLAGALTSCQAWFNGPINATASAGVGAVGSAVAGAALLAPK